MSQEIDRALWRVLCPSGDLCDDRVVTVRAGGVDIEADEGLVEVSVFAHEDGVDVRVGELQLVAKGRHVALMRREGPFPIQRWTILFEGDLP